MRGFAEVPRLDGGDGAIDRAAAEDEKPECDAERVDVAAVVEPVFADLLRAGEQRAAAEWLAGKRAFGAVGGAGGKFGEFLDGAEIRELDLHLPLAGRVLEQQVGRLDIAVDETRLMDSPQAGAGLGGERGQLDRCQAAALDAVVLERAATAKLHGIVQLAIHLALFEVTHHVLVAEPAEHLEFPVKLGLLALGLDAARLDNLQRDIGFQRPAEDHFALHALVGGAGGPFAQQKKRAVRVAQHFIFTVNERWGRGFHVGNAGWGRFQGLPGEAMVVSGPGAPLVAASLASIRTASGNDG